jgi:hypothetical protein
MNPIATPKLVGLGLAQTDIGELSGRAAWVALAKANEAATAAALLEMREAVMLSKVDNSPVRLHISKAANERRFLRWTIKNIGCTWEVAESALVSMSVDVQRHYKSLNRRALELNAVTSICSGARTDIRRLMYANGWAKPPKTTI